MLFRSKSAAQKLEKAAEDLDKRLKKLLSDLSKRNREKSILDRDYDQFGLSALKQSIDDLKTELQPSLEAVAKQKQKPKEVADSTISEDVLDAFLKCYARLDGYDMCLRSVESVLHDQKPMKSEAEEPSSDVLAWVTPVRKWAKFETWKDPQSDEEVKKPTHDATGLVDPAYVKWLIEQCNAFQDDGIVKPEYLELLDPDCIEAADLNLSAGRHKPFTFAAGKHEDPAVVIRQLDKLHDDIRKKLIRLLQMVEGGRK